MGDCTLIVTLIQYIVNGEQLGVLILLCSLIITHYTLIYKAKPVKQIVMAHEFETEAFSTAYSVVLLDRKLRLISRYACQNQVELVIKINGQTLKLTNYILKRQQY